MGQMKIGWAKRNVSTDKPVNIPGQFHMRISTGVLDPLFATALVVENGGDLVCFVSIDVVVIRSFLLDNIRDKVAKLLPGFPVEKIIVNATHTHTAPSHYHDNGWPKSTTLPTGPAPDDQMPVEMDIASGDEYRDFLSTQAAEAVAEAYNNRKEGGVAWGYGYAVVAHSRRVTYADDLSMRPGAIKNSTHGVNGHSAMYGNTNDPMFLGYQAGADHFINLMYTSDADSNLTGAIVNVPCPSQNSEGMYQLSASFWNEVRVQMKNRPGDIFVLPQAAAAGDLSPRILHYKAAQERRFKLKYGRERAFAEEFERLDIAERIADAFDEVLAWAKKDIRTDLPVAHSVETVQLSRRKLSEEDVKEDREMLKVYENTPFKTDGTPVENLTFNSRLIASRNRCRGIIKKFEDYQKCPTIPMELHTVSFGDEFAFATNRFELYMDYMHRIQARSPFPQTFIIQLTGVPGAEGGSYLATERGVWGRGYSASKYCNVCSPKGGQELVENTLRMLNELKAKDKQA